MGLFTILTEEEILSLINQFQGLPTNMPQIQSIAAGTVNTYYRLTYSQEEIFYLKLDEVGKKDTLNGELEVYRFLATHKSALAAKIPQLLTLKDSEANTTSIKGKTALLLTAVAGHSLTRDQLTPNHLRQVGEEIARWHNLSITQNRNLPYHRFTMVTLNQILQDIHQLLTTKHPELPELIAALLRDVTCGKQFDSGTNVLIHADLFPDNLFWQNDQLSGIIDFDAAGCGDPLFDIGVCCHALCYEEDQKFHQDKFQAFLQGYNSQRKLSSDQAQAWPRFFKMTALRFLITRLRDFELSPNPEKLTDFRDFNEYLLRLTEPMPLLS